LHDVGRIVIACAFPRHFAELRTQAKQGQNNLRLVEMEVLGMDHAALGALYLRNHGLKGILVETAEHHHHPERATYRSKVIAAVQVADLLARHVHIGQSLNCSSVTSED